MAQQRNDNTLEWWNNRYSMAGVRKIWSSKKRLQFYNMIATAIPKGPATILDVGSGFGFGPAHLVSICKDWHIEGLDFSTKACVEAVVKTHCIDVTTDHFPGIYDYVVSAETLEHLSDPITILAKLYQAARKAVILTVPYLGNVSTIHVTSFDKNSFNKYPNVRIELSSDNHFMLVVIPKNDNGGS